MRPRLVFVHGIGGPQDAEADLEEWLRAAAHGARAAGHGDRLSGLTGGWAADTRFAYYGDLFRTPGSQGTGAAAPADRASGQDEGLVAGLLLEAVDERLADPATAPEEARVLRHARTQLAPPGGAQGAGAPGRHVVNALTTLMALPGLRSAGGWLSARLTAGALGQVARYLNRGEPGEDGAPLDARIRRRVAACLDDDGPTVVVAHSLGTVVALETLHAHRGEVPLLVTLGSPMGTRAAVLPRVRPQPPSAPACVGRWLNFWDRDDIVAARPRLEDFVLPNASSVRPVSSRVDSDGAWVHPAAKYLAQAAVAGPLVEALAAARS
ncbi:alpha/beta hydrolase [Streptomyces somaliensis DSM 40738]|uniref:Alpha/beta hydrolase n=1 Tax=Streptomyces somaliensis (strain ATCC 33201 / DSM 40738 / JCM 12659 / KCTC 9044 / NCTC 11332 / NRRL B-12077 / IP 733) TaxID=1134445 RepID=A0AA44DFM4_STRE0|nr:alpha/beta hydrolase [Streptomyces somaliensis]MCQ0025431.1 alpha/beta hydrolase [Streptomyces somaliensis DSM 40738]NKY16003.1 alpha/beta hydrolase [Streptomyces somaliensis DSM 40738]